MLPEMERLISAFKLRLRMHSPFFATLALFAGYRQREDIPTAATDGKDIFFNPDFFSELPAGQADGVLLHEVLHAALLHNLRRGSRVLQLWNIAADIVVNGLIVKEGVFELAEGAIECPEHAHLSVEEIYELLLRKRIPAPPLAQLDLLAPEGADSRPEKVRAELESYWERARQQAFVVSRSSRAGKTPEGLTREFGALDPAQLDWRAHLWGYLVQTPSDFSGFDRRFVGRGLYLEALEGESLRVHLAVDTSGSIEDRELELFLGEVRGVLGSYPHLECDLYYADAALHGPYQLHADSEFPPPVGGGGTSFVPFFERMEQERAPHGESVCIYLTDGYDDFPEQPSSHPVLWVVTTGGLDLPEFPFGEAVRLIE